MKKKLIAINDKLYRGIRAQRNPNLRISNTLRRSPLK